MSESEYYEISVKDYATQRGKTVQAVYQQMKSKENAAALEGHIVVRRVGNKDVKFLDATAVEILNKSSSSAPVTYIQDDLRADLEEAKAGIELAKLQLAERLGEINTLRGLLAEKESELRQLAAPATRITELETVNSTLAAERDAALVKASTIEGAHSMALQELDAAREDVRESRQRISALEHDNTTLAGEHKSLIERNGITEQNLQKVQTRYQELHRAWEEYWALPFYKRIFAKKPEFPGEILGEEEWKN